VEFSRLRTITNMPIGRFRDDLVTAGAYDRYMEALVAAFNPSTVAGLMCRTTVSVGWDGRLFDCDFNQMLDLPPAPGLPRQIREFHESLRGRRIAVGPHCFGCTAGCGSGCRGAIVG
jgi:radical SAM/Cys-rich protein